jgi:phenolic acid decarboxylase
MNADPVRGKTIRWTFTDGSMADHRFEHLFHEDGTVEFRMLDGKANGKPTKVDKYEVATVGAKVFAVSYLGPAGYTLTVVLDFQTGRIVGFASNEKELSVQHGTFEAVDGSKNATRQ